MDGSYSKVTIYVAIPAQKVLWFIWLLRIADKLKLYCNSRIKINLLISFIFHFFEQKMSVVEILSQNRSFNIEPPGNFFGTPQTIKFYRFPHSLGNQDHLKRGSG